MGERNPRLDKPRLITQSLWMEPLSARHAEQVVEAIGDSRSELRRWLPFPDRMHAPEDVLPFIRRMRRSQAHIVWGIWERHESGSARSRPGDYCGTVGLHQINRDQGLGTIGYWVRTRLCGRGLATEASAAVLLWAFGPLGLARVSVESATGNHGSQRVIAKLGFVREGRLRQAQALPSRRRRLDWYVYGLVRGDARRLKGRWARLCGTPYPWRP